jgi:hypothetical protein
MRALAALVVLAGRPEPSARTRPLFLAVPGELAATLGLRAQVRPGLMGLPALRCHAMVVLAARAAPVALARTAALVEPAAVEPQVAVAMAGLVRLPSVALAAPAASAVQGLMRAD